MQGQGVTRGAKFGFGRSRRVRLRSDATQLFAQGSKCFEFPYRGSVRVRAGQSDASALAGCRLLAVVPKRVCKLSVSRNAQKRRMRELFRVESAELQAECQRRKVLVDIALLLVSSECVSLNRARRAVRKVVRYAERQVVQTR